MARTISGRNPVSPETRRRSVNSGGAFCRLARGSRLPCMEGADQGEEAPGGEEIDFHLALQALGQKLRALIVNPAPGHVDRFDLVR